MFVKDCPTFRKMLMHCFENLICILIYRIIVTTNTVTSVSIQCRPQCRSMGSWNSNYAWPTTIRSAEKKNCFFWTCLKSRVTSRKHWWSFPFTPDCGWSCCAQSRKSSSPVHERLSIFQLGYIGVCFLICSVYINIINILIFNIKCVVLI